MGLQMEEKGRLMTEDLEDVRKTAGDARGHRAGWLGPLARIALVLIVAGGVLELQAAVGYRVPSGSVSFRARPAWPGGHLIMPLGPAGELSLRTHHTPVDVVMDYQLPSQTAALLGGASGGEVPRLEGGAREAFSRYLLSRVPWLLLVGATAGLRW